MRRLGVVWTIFGLGLALAAGAMARLGATALELERAEGRARRQASLEENVQIALWRMDSALAPLMAEEGARPYFAYTPFSPAERAFTRMFAEVRRGDVLIASPLLTAARPEPRVRLHFQFGPDGRLTSPAVPSGTMRELAEARYRARDSIERASRRLDELRTLVTRDALAAVLSDEGTNSAVDPNPGPPPVFEQGPMAGPMGQGMPKPIQPGQSRGSTEYLMRSKLNQAPAPREAGPSSMSMSTSARSAVSQGPLQAAWVGPTLVLARRVTVEEGTFIQGCWLDWDAIRRDLLAGVADLVPMASLEPVVGPGPSAAAPARMLASVPARLVPGPVPDGAASGVSPATISLRVAWACLAIAATAVALVLRGALALSERRGAFVSAVTHELRTPLTTFRLYTEMLDEGMVPGEDARRAYLRTLRAEADRLGHLVENVLAFARLEHGRWPEAREVVPASDLIGRLAPRLASRAAQAGMTLVVEPSDLRLGVRADPSVVDQILSNLVDNAVKYAGGAEDRRIHLALESTPRGVALILVDHGPGLRPRAARRLFRPFSKSADDAAHSAPGIGLGLALSRRLARSQGGDLRLVGNGPRGARFALTLPGARGRAVSSQLSAVSEDGPASP